MTTEHILNVMDGIDPALVEEIDLTGKKKRRLSPPLRTGLIAACVCLALLGSTFAATLRGGVFFGETVSEEFCGVTCDGIRLQAEGLTALPHEAFREEFWQTVEENEALCMDLNPEHGRTDIPLQYLSWEKAQEDMGITLAKNEVLEEMPQGACNIHGAGNPRFWVSSKYIVGNHMCVFVDAHVFVSEIPFDNFSILTEPSYEVISTESYIMPDESSAVIQEIRFTDPYDRDIRSPENLLDCDIYSAYLVRDGFLYQVMVINEGPSPEEGRELLKTILSGFVQ